jgi:hypothetical protein
MRYRKGSGRQSLGNAHQLPVSQRQRLFIL